MTWSGFIYFYLLNHWQLFGGWTDRKGGRGWEDLLIATARVLAKAKEGLARAGHMGVETKNSWRAPEIKYLKPNQKVGETKEEVGMSEVSSLGNTGEEEMWRGKDQELWG